MELLDYVKSIGGRITFKGGYGCDNNSIMVQVKNGFTDLSRRRGSLIGSLVGWAKLTKNLNKCYDAALAHLAQEMSGETVSFGSEAPYTCPKLIHTKRRKKVMS